MKLLLHGLQCCLLAGLLLIGTSRSASPDTVVSDVFSIWSASGPANQPVVSGPAMDQIQDFVGSRPVFIVAIVGGYHTGKSSMLNVLLERDFFTVGSSMKSETQSFDAVVVKDNSNDEEKPAIIVIDTPGTGAYEFGNDLQAAYFGAAYLISSTMVYNTLRQVGSRESLDFLAQRLRWVLSVNATVPEECELKPNTAEVKLEWVVQNADFNATQEHPEAQLQRYIDDFSEQVFDLKEIFPKGIHPHILPSPGDFHMMQHLSADYPESRWNPEYLSAMKALRTRLFEGISTSKVDGKLPRVFSNFNVWRKRVYFAFSEPVANNLKSLEEAPVISAKKAMEEALIDEARSYAYDHFNRKSENVSVCVISVYEKRLLDIQEEAIALMKRRAVAVPEKTLKSEADKEIKSFYKGEIKRLVAEMSKRIDVIWADAVRASALQYTANLKHFVAIPFDPRDGKSLSAEKDRARALLKSTVGVLADDTLLWEKQHINLVDEMTRRDSVHRGDNDRAIDEIISAYTTFVEGQLESLAKKESEDWNEALEPQPHMVERIDGLLGDIIMVSCSVAGIKAPQSPIPVSVVAWITNELRFKSLKGSLTEPKSQLMRKVKLIHDKRITRKISTLESSVQRSATACFNEVIKELPLPTGRFKSGLAACESPATQQWVDATKEFATHPSVVTARSAHDRFMTAEQRRITDVNNAAIRKLASGIANEVRESMKKTYASLQARIEDRAVVEDVIKSEVNLSKESAMTSFANKTQLFSDTVEIYDIKTALFSEIKANEKQILDQNVKAILKLATATTFYLKETYIESVVFSETLELPAEEAVINDQAKTSKIKCAEMWEKEIGSFARSHSHLLEAMIKDWELTYNDWVRILRAENAKQMEELVKEPSMVAKRKFMKHLNDCAQMGTTDRLLKLSCFKIDSKIGLDSLKTTAKTLLQREIKTAIDKTRAEHKKESKSGQSGSSSPGAKKRKLLVSMSTSMITAVTESKLASWWIEPDLAHTTQYSYIASAVCGFAFIGVIAIVDTKRVLIWLILVVAMIAAFLFV